MSRPYAPTAEGSGSHTSVSEQERVALAEAALDRNDWSSARAAWHELACAIPQNTRYRNQLMFARAGELLESGDSRRAREELERLLRAVPGHTGATAMLKKLPKLGAFGRFLRR
jgi:uncharacterized membrane-anchored protein